MTYPADHRRSHRGFTLMEVLLVLVILVILVSFTGVFIRGARKRAFRHAARMQISLFEEGLKQYELDIRNYPSNDQSLKALLNKPSGLSNESRWDGPYLDAKVLPLDPWDRPYRYELLDADTYRISSAGPDGAERTEDDISSD